MTRRKFESITGRYPKVASSDGMAVAEALDDNGKVMASAFGKTETAALEALLIVTYQVHSRLAMERDKWRCSMCGRIGKLEIDHIKARSKGRDDRVENLRSVCSGPGGCGFHQRRHGG